MSRTFLLLVLAVLLASIATPRALAGQSPAAWLKSAHLGGSPRLTVAFVSGHDDHGAPEFISFDGAAFSSLGIFTAVDVRNTRLTYLLNRRSPKLRAADQQESLRNVFSLTGA